MARELQEEIEREVVRLSVLEAPHVAATEADKISDTTANREVDVDAPPKNA